MKIDELKKFHPMNEDNLKGLQNAYSEGKLVPFVGAGLGIPPYKVWGEALKSICSVVPSALPQLERLLAENNYELAASHVYDSLKIARFSIAFKKEFSPELIQEHGLSEAMKMLPSIFPGLVFTTNYDRCLETSYSMAGRAFSAIYNIREKQGYQDVIDRMLRGQPHYLYKIHGDIENLSGRVLLKEEYDELYKENGPFVELLLSCFTVKCFLFLGCSMTGTDRYMQVLKQIAERHTIPNYAILPTLRRKEHESEKEYQARTEEWESLLSEHWILPVFYPAGDYSSVTEVLKALNTTPQKTPGKGFVHHTGFYGRQSLVEEIQAHLKTKRYLLVHGEPGIGKTQVCEEIVSRFEGNIATVYLQGSRGYLSLLQSMQNALGLASSQSEKTKDQMKQAIMTELCSRSTDEPFLIYFDNFEDVLLQNDAFAPSQNNTIDTVEDDDPSVDLLVELINSMPKQCHLLISSRDVLTGFPSKKVKPLDDSSMLMLFQRVFEQAGGRLEQLEQEESALTELIHHLSGLPLAAVLAASQVTVSKSVRRILALWNTLGDSNVRVAIDQNPTHKALKTALLVSYKHIGENHDAKLLWGYLALVSQDLPDKLAELLLPNTLPQSEKCLITLSLADRNQTGNGLSMLEPIKRQAFIYEPDIEEECSTRLTEVYCSLIDECFGNQSNWHLAVEYSGDILYFLNNLCSHKTQLSYRLLKNFIECDSNLSNLIAYRPRTGVSLLEKIIANDDFFDTLADSAKAVLYGGLADCQFLISLYDGALENYKKAQKLYESLGMKKRASRLMHYMGNLEYWRSNYSEAEAQYLEAKKLFEETDDKDGLAWVLESLGTFYLKHQRSVTQPGEKMEENKKTIDYLNQAKSLAEQNNMRLLLAHIYFDFGEYYSRQQNIEKDIPIEQYNKALELYEIEQDRLGQGNVLRGLGNIYFSSDPELALKYYEKAIVAFRDAEMPEGYYSGVSRKIQSYNRRNVNPPRDDTYFDVEKLVARIDQKIAELDAMEVLKRANDYNSRLSALVIYCSSERTQGEMRKLLGLSSQSYFRQRYLSPLLKSGKIRMTMPDKPTSKYQMYIKT